MSFLSELKSQANALQGLELGAQRDLMAGAEACEKACRIALAYLQDLCAQLNVIQPVAPGSYSLDGKVPFPALAQLNFRCDARRKMLRNSLSAWVTPDGWATIGVDPKARAEDLTTVEFVAISDWALVNKP